MNRRITALALAGVFALGLTACSAPGATGGNGDDSDFGTQSVTEACATFSSAMADTEAALTKAMEDATTDPAKSVEALGTLQTNMEDAFSSVSNSKVAALGDKVLASLGTFAEVASDVIGNGDMTRVTELSEASNEFTSAMQELQTLCS